LVTNKLVPKKNVVTMKNTTPKKIFKLLGIKTSLIKLKSVKGSGEELARDVRAPGWIPLMARAISAKIKVKTTEKTSGKNKSR